jgi:riboflavin synthase
LFTGLIEGIGRVIRRTGDTLLIEEQIFPVQPARGESLCVDGVCLTVGSSEPGRLLFHCSGETLSRTIAGRYQPGSAVNLERPLGVEGRLHGHLVTGHVDSTASVLRVERDGSGATVWFSFPGKHALLLVEKGSVAVSGISLTVASLAPDRFSAALIPETLERTTAGAWKPGTAVNLEFDIIGKYILRQADAARGADRLRENLE